MRWARFEEALGFEIFELTPRMPDYHHESKPHNVGVTELRMYFGRDGCWLMVSGKRYARGKNTVRFNAFRSWLQKYRWGCCIPQCDSLP
ncbi:hypothetical protein O9992_20055 [Vibrio lentus]|nr:hypothetical protein [Vibrio lentus]